MRTRFYKAACRRREVGVGVVARSCGHWEPSISYREPQSNRDLHITIAVVSLELGAGNVLFIRGQGGGLSWNKGQALNWVNAKTWVWSPKDTHERVEFQLLLNDQVWERGEPHIVEPGDAIEVTPDFEWPDIPRTSSG